MNTLDPPASSSLILGLQVPHLPFPININKISETLIKFGIQYFNLNHKTVHIKFALKKIMISGINKVIINSVKKILDCTVKKL